MDKIFKIILSCSPIEIPWSMFVKYRGIYLVLINVLKLNSSCFTRLRSIAKSGNAQYSYSSKIPVSNSRQVFMERSYLSSVSSQKELLDLSLPHGFQLNSLAGLLRKKNYIARWVTNAVVYISAKKWLLTFVCTKGSMIRSTLTKGLSWNQDTQQQHWMKSLEPIPWHSQRSVLFKISCFESNVNLYSHGSW